jgi:hypothetical protein
MWALRLIVVDPFPIRRAHRITIKNPLGELLRVRAVRIGSPDVNPVRASVEPPREKQVAIAALVHLQDPGIRIVKDGGLLSTIGVHASQSLSVGNEQLAVGRPGDGLHILGLRQRFDRTLFSRLLRSASMIPDSYETGRLRNLEKLQFSNPDSPCSTLEAFFAAQFLHAFACPAGARTQGSPC